MENAEKQGSHLGEYGLFSTSDLFPCSKYFLSFQKKKKKYVTLYDSFQVAT